MAKPFTGVINVDVTESVAYHGHDEVTRAGEPGRLDGRQHQERLGRGVRGFGRMSRPDATEEDGSAGRRGVRVVTDVPRQMLRVAYRDPEHICERLTLQAVHRLAEPSLEWAQLGSSRSPGWRSAPGVRRPRNADREDRAPAGDGGRNSVLPRARAGVHELLVAGGPYEPTARGTVWPRSGHPPDRGRAAVATRGVSDHAGRGDRSACRRRHGHAAQAGASEAAATVDRMRSSPARVRWIHRPPNRRVAPGSARPAEGCSGARCLRRSLGDHLDLPGDLHDHDGVGMRDPLAPAVPAHA